MRTILIAIMLVLTLAACGTKDDSVEQPMPEATAEQPATPAQPTDSEVPKSTYTVKDEVPVGPVGVLQLADGSSIEITELIKLGEYYLYLTGKLNGRTSTVVSFTRFRDLKRWEAFIFKDAHNFIITTKAGKELIFMDARLYLGSDSADTYSFYTVDEDFNKVIATVKKSDVATIKLQ